MKCCKTNKIILTRPSILIIFLFTLFHFLILSLITIAQKVCKIIKAVISSFSAKLSLVWLQQKKILEFFLFIMFTNETK